MGLFHSSTKPGEILLADEESDIHRHLARTWRARSYMNQVILNGFLITALDRPCSRPALALSDILDEVDRIVKRVGICSLPLSSTASFVLVYFSPDHLP